MLARSYPFYRLQDQRGKKTPPWRMYLPIRLSNPNSSLSVIVYGLVDTGADASLLPASIAAQLGHSLKGHGVRENITTGIENRRMTVYRHTFDVELLTATGGAVARSFKGVLIDCAESNPPVLLGVSDFAQHFVWNIDYTSRDLLLEW